MRIFFKYLQLIWRFSPSQTLLFFSLLVLSSITQSLGIVILFPLLSLLQDDPQEATGIFDIFVEFMDVLSVPMTLIGILFIFLCIRVLHATISLSYNVISDSFRLNFLDSLRRQSFDAVLYSKWQWIANSKRSDISNLLITEIEQIGVGLFYSIRLIVALITVAVYVAISFTISASMTLIAVIFGALLTLVLKGQFRRSREQGETTTDANKDVQQIIDEGLTGLKLTKILRNEARHSQLMVQVRDRLRKQLLNFTKLNALTGWVFQTAVAIGIVLFIYLGAEVFDLSMTKLLILILIFARLAPQLRQIQSNINYMSYSAASFENFDQILKSAMQNQDVLIDDSTDQMKLNSALYVDDVSYSFPERSIAALNNISVKIPAKKTTAIMGMSGAGKSTLADIIIGLLYPSSGQVKIDDYVLSDENRDAWRRSVSYVTQDVFLFHDTIRNNLLWGRADATEQDLTLAVKKASAEFVFDLPQGLETVVGDGGMRLSGGERQRLSLARALLRKPTLLILDEATSALDVENEARIRQTIDQLHGDLTVVVIGHRLPTLQNADQLIILKNGKVEAAGKWDEVKSFMPHIK